jgi:hypothetical protein
VIERLRRHYRRRTVQRQIVATAFVAFGALWLVVEPLGLFFPDDLDFGWGGYATLVVLSVAVALIRSRTREVVERALPPSDVRVMVRVGDVLKQHGNVVVGSNDTFDTTLRDDVISARSVQGQLLATVFGGNQTELDRQIEQSLAGVDGKHDPAKTFEKTERYPIGTVAVVRSGQTRYFLPAFAEMSTTKPANVKATVEGLQTSLVRTWEAIGTAGNREPVHAPIIGANLSRLGLSRTLLIEMIVVSFIAVVSKTGTSNSLTVWIHEPEATHVDMVALDEWLRGLCAT